jgi:CRISPR-associated helicase Cas3/CRISPR-associated endonuclease Cas3-HD
MADDRVQLDQPARSVWAKSPAPNGSWLPLWQHMDDSADTAGLLFDHWLAPNVVRLMADEFGGSADDARTAVTFLAGVHDLGKATPAFAVQDVHLAQQMRAAGLYMPETKRQLDDRHLAHHAVAGHHLLIRWFVAEGWRRGVARTWGVVLGGHHGVPPDAVAEQAAAPDLIPHLYGRDLWESVQKDLAQRVAARTGASRRFDEWQGLKLSQQFQVLATGLVIVSDWIASNEELFPYLSGELPDVHDHTDRAACALAKLQLPSAWRIQRPPTDVDELFGARFTLPVGARPRPVQHLVADVARRMPEPGLMIVEAPMGEGKTEAALAAAEIVAEQWGAGGLLVALPTQATTDAMFDRVVAWLDRMGAGEQEVGGSIVLSHGKARFNRLFRGLMAAGRAREVSMDERLDRQRREADAYRVRRSPHAVVAHTWLSGRKKAQLANFTIGTIDQLLFAGLKARHLMLRHLGLAGKVVILDEIHAYDAYMNSYLTKVLTWLGAYRVPVIALSATLPGDRRCELVKAYQAGRTGGVSTTGDSVDVGGDIGYPVVIWTEKGEARTAVAEASGRQTTMHVQALSDDPADDLDELVSVLREQLSDGGSALVVRNTVRRVLATAERLQAEFPGEVTVTHSRFITADRLAKDAWMLSRFGPPSGADRPHRHIVVASQVVEQSLDVDFDLLVTDLAPIDLMLQRMGRIHRHRRGDAQSDRPPKLRAARTYVAAVDFSASPPALDKIASRYVYDAHSLLRAAAVLLPRVGGQVELPEDIAPLVQAAYGEDSIGPAAWQDAMREASEDWRRKTEIRVGKAELFQIVEPARPGKAIVGWVAANVGDTDDESLGQGQVRDGAPSLEAMLVQRDRTGRL